MINNFFKTTFGMAWIVLVDDPTERLQIQFVPENIQWDRSPMTVAINPIGRNHPFYHFTGGEDTLNFPLSFYADDLAKNSALEKVQWLNSLTYVNGTVGPPPTVKLIFGKMFQRHQWVIRRVSTELGGFDFLRSLRPNFVTVTLQMALAPRRNLTPQDAKLLY